MFKGLFLIVLSAFNEAFQLNWGDIVKKKFQNHKKEFNLYKKRG